MVTRLLPECRSTVKTIAGAPAFSDSDIRSQRCASEAPFEASSIDAVILTHAHLDHASNLPSLVRAGFRGKIFTTSATEDLCSYMLVDSAHIQKSDVRYVNRRRKREGKSPFEPLYQIGDVYARSWILTGNCEPIGVGRAQNVTDHAGVERALR